MLEGKSTTISWDSLTDSQRTQWETLRKNGIVSLRAGLLQIICRVRQVVADRIPDGCLTAPIRVYDTITRRCALNCEQCCVSSTAKFDENRRSHEQTLEIMRKFQAVGTTEWRFTGGEPTSCDDFLECVKAARMLGMEVMVNTSGCWNRRVREELPTMDVRNVIVSLEGREAVNDHRRAPGVFQEVMQTFDRIDQVNASISRRSIRVTINMTIAQDNVGEIEHIAKLAARRGYNLNVGPLRPYGRSLTHMQGKMLTTEGFKRFSALVQKVREDAEIVASGIKIIHRNMDLYCPDYPDYSIRPFPFNYSSCGALTTGFGLGPDGRTNACTFMMDDPDFQGLSLLDHSVQDAWLHPKMERMRRARRIGCEKCRFYMRQCEGKCPAMVLANQGCIENGRLLGRDPYCFLEEKNKEERDETLSNSG